MLFAPHNFLTFIKLIVTGGGRNANGVPANDAGFLKETQYPISSILPTGLVALTDNSAGTANDTIQALPDPTDTPATADALRDDLVAVLIPAIRNNFADVAAKINAILAANAGTAAETNLRIFSSAASTTNVGTVEFAVPRDYDEATDVFKLRLMAAMAGATDTPALTVTVYRKRAGANIATLVTAKAMDANFGATALSSAAQMVEFDLSGYSLLRDDVLTIVITSAAHTTDALYVYSVTPMHRSTIVSYNELNSSNRDLR